MAVVNAEVYEPFYERVSVRCLMLFQSERDLEPFWLLDQLMALEGLPMHCPVHHHILPAVLLTVLRKKRGESEAQLAQDLRESEKRARHVLPGFCGFYGACGSAVGVGIFVSVFCGTTPLATDGSWETANRATADALLRIASLGGPRCCKRTSYTALLSALPTLNALSGLALDAPAAVRCHFHERNQECLQNRCPYYPF